MAKRVGALAAVVALMILAGACVPDAPPTPPTTTVQRSVPATCVGADVASRTLLSSLGASSVALDATVSVTAPTVLPAANGDVPVTVSWSATSPIGALPFAFGSPTATVRNGSFDLAVSGQTATTVLPLRAAPITVPVTDRTLAFGFGPVATHLTSIGSSGSVTVAARAMSFTLEFLVSGSPRAINLTCSANQVITTIPIA